MVDNEGGVEALWKGVRGSVPDDRCGISPATMSFATPGDSPPRSRCKAMSNECERRRPLVDALFTTARERRRLARSATGFAATARSFHL